MQAGEIPDHAQVGANRTGVLYGALEGKPCRIYSSDVRVRLSETRYVHPDVAVSCDRRDRGQEKTIAFPCLIIEVLSPGTETYDRKRKRMYYQACSSVQEYVLVHTHYQWVEVFRREQNNLWTYHAFEDGDEVTFTSLDVHFPISKLYRNVDLPVDTGESEP